MDERLLTGRDANINGPHLSCAVKLSSVVSFTASPFRPRVDAHLVPKQPFPLFPKRRSRRLRLELCALSPTCNEIPHRHTANPSQFSGLILSPITDAARSRVDTSCRGTVRTVKESKNQDVSIYPHYVTSVSSIRDRIILLYGVVTVFCHMMSVLLCTHLKVPIFKTNLSMFKNLFVAIYWVTLMLMLFFFLAI